MHNCYIEMTPRHLPTKCYNTFVFFTYIIGTDDTMFFEMLFFYFYF
jgi:hypothetical protein